MQCVFSLLWREAFLRSKLIGFLLGYKIMIHWLAIGVHKRITRTNLTQKSTNFVVMARLPKVSHILMEIQIYISFDHQISLDGQICDTIVACSDQVSWVPKEVTHFSSSRYGIVFVNFSVFCYIPCTDFKHYEN